MTTPSRCEPPEEWREVEGWHFLKAYNGELFAFEWVPRLGGYWSKLDSVDLKAHHFGYIYYSPALPDAAAEIKRLRTALKNIAADGSPGTRSMKYMTVNECREAARAALARERTA